jgi:hypothetical protein
MKRLFIPVLLLMAACEPPVPKETPVSKKDVTWSAMPQVADLSEYPQTAFVPTLEHAIPANKNVVYSSAFLYAWSGLRNYFKNSIKPGGQSSADLQLVNKSRSYEQTLSESEYSVDYGEQEGVVWVHAFFNKTLPLTYPLDNLDYLSKTFKGKAVAMAGIDHLHYPRTEEVELSFYKNDDKFVLKLLPAALDNEILFASGVAPASTLAEAWKHIRKMIADGKKQEHWLGSDDMFAIPCMKFNIKTNYPGIERQMFDGKGQAYEVIMATQRTGFIFNEKGAVVESEADVVAAVVDTMMPVPKNLVLDDTYFIVIKKVTAENPYFMMKVDNTELMKR